MNILFGIDVLFGPTETWPTPYPLEIIVGSIIIAILIITFLVIRYNASVKKIQSQAHQLFLFKSKQLGLSNYQFKIINGLVNISGIHNPNKILLNTALFEASIGKFLDYLKKANEKEDSLAKIGKDIIITYEKIFHNTTYRKPINLIEEIDINTLICLITHKNEIVIGKTKSIGIDGYYIEIFRKISAIQNIVNENIRAFLWRSGDAEYTFTTKIVKVSNSDIVLELPKEIVRGKEVRLPYIEVMIPCKITIASSEISDIDDTDKDEISGNIFKINEGEAVVRISSKLDYKSNYSISFVVDSFNISIKSKLLSDRTIHEQNIRYYTFKFYEISEVAENILKTYIKTHL